MIKLDKTYTGHKQWKIGGRQELIAEEGEDINDAIEFMRAHIEYFGHKHITFSEKEITQFGNRYIFLFRPKRY